MPETDGFERHFNRLMRSRGSAVTLDQFEAAKVENDGNLLHLDIIGGNPGGATVVFVPGTAAYGLVYGDFLAALAEKGFYIVSLDPRGHGKSEGMVGSYTIKELVSDARAAIKFARERFAGPVYISGSSQGGIVAFYCAAEDNNLDGAICHNAADLADPYNFEVTTSPRVAKALSALIRILARLIPNAPINIRRYFSLLSKGEQKAKDRMARDPYMLKIIRLRALASLSSEKMACAVEDIRTPVLMLHAGRDTIFPQQMSQNLHDRLTCEKNLLVYPDLGHFLFTEHVDQVVPDIARWITERSR